MIVRYSECTFKRAEKSVHLFPFFFSLLCICVASQQPLFHPTKHTPSEPTPALFDLEMPFFKLVCKKHLAETPL